MMTKIFKRRLIIVKSRQMLFKTLITFYCKYLIQVKNMKNYGTKLQNSLKSVEFSKSLFPASE